MQQRKLCQDLRGTPAHTINAISQESTFAIDSTFVEGNGISVYNSQPAVHQPIQILHTKNGCLLIPALCFEDLLFENKQKLGNFINHPLPPHLTTSLQLNERDDVLGAPNSTTTIITPSLTIL